MHIQIVTFTLQGLTDTEYAKVCEQQFVAAFREMEGLVSKVWLSDPERNAYGGVYTWRDKAAMRAYLESDLFRGILANPFLKDVTSTDYAVLEMPTRVTRGWAAAA